MKTKRKNFPCREREKLDFFRLFHFSVDYRSRAPAHKEKYAKKFREASAYTVEARKRASEMHFLQRTPSELFASLLNGKSRENVRTHMRAPTPGTKQHFSEYDSLSLPTTTFGALV